MHSHLGSPGQVFHLYHGPVAHQSLFSKGLQFSATTGIFLLLDFNSLHCDSPAGSCHKLPTASFSTTVTSMESVISHDSKPYLKRSPGITFSWALLLGRAVLLGIECIVPRTWRSTPKSVLPSLRKGMQDAVICFFSVLGDMSARPWPLDLWIFHRVYFPSSGLRAAYQDLQCTYHFLFCLIRVMSGNVILGQSYKCMFLSLLCECELLLIL